MELFAYGNYGVDFYNSLFPNCYSLNVEEDSFFGRSFLPYLTNPNSPYKYIFHPDYVSTGMELVKGLGIATVIGIIISRIALAWGNWMAQVKR